MKFTIDFSDSAIAKAIDEFKKNRKQYTYEGLRQFIKNLESKKEQIKQEKLNDGN